MDRIQKRFDEMTDLAAKVTDSTRPDSDGIGESVDFELLVEWKTSVLSLLTRVFGSDSPTVESFKSCGKGGFFVSSRTNFDEPNAIFKSAKSDFEGGYLFDVRNLVHADVFSDELEQASNWLKMGHKVASAVIAGTVLETTVRELCEQHPAVSTHEKMDMNNSSLAREGIYNKMMADQVRAWAKIRNSAAHGRPDEFQDGDVTRMIDGIRDFVARHMA